MKLIERYVFRKLLFALLLSFLGLSLTIWLTQILQRFNLVSNRGQSVFTFLELSGLIFPSLVTVIAPVSVLAAMIYVLNTMNTDSELVSIGASGGSSSLLLRPTIAIGILIALVVGLSAVFVTPNTQLASRKLLMRVNAEVVTSVLREGQFLTVAPKLTIQVRHRQANGLLEGIFVFDDRDPDQSIAYLSKTGLVIDNDLGRFLALADGVIQRQERATGNITAIEFQSYVFDLATLQSQQDLPYLQVGERSTWSLMNPESNDPIFQRSPNMLKSELHDRLTAPLYVLVFALLPLAILGQPRTARQGFGLPTVMAVSLAVDLRGIGFVLNGVVRDVPAIVPVLYIVPILAIIGCLVVIALSIRFTAPHWVLAAGDFFKRRFSGWTGERSTAGG